MSLLRAQKEVSLSSNCRFYYTYKSNLLETTRSTPHAGNFGFSLWRWLCRSLLWNFYLVTSQFNFSSELLTSLRPLPRWLWDSRGSTRPCWLTPNLKDVFVPCFLHKKSFSGLFSEGVRAETAPARMMSCRRAEITSRSGALINWVCRC